MKKIEEELELNKKYIIRILLSKKGMLSYEKSEIHHSLKKSSVLLFSTTPVNEQNIFLFHKTNYRPWFEKALNNIKANKCFDMVFCNLQGQITEGARSNIFIEKNGKLYTPPLSCGLLPGILRKVLLNQKKCYEKILHPEDIFNAERIYCGNSVRGLIVVKPQK
jgi:para-aminobenzoate synthetase/4-amino-4-deoxychorismate lyase